MKKLFVSALMINLFFGCKKDTIDLSAIYAVDNIGNQIGPFPNDNQWKSQIFSDKEMDLFKSLDTANLSGTTIASFSQHYYAYPNPSSTNFSIPAILTPPASGGSIVVKFVVVNGYMLPVKKGAVRVKLDSTGFAFIISGDFDSGSYRVYFTFSAEGHEHFFKSWGNILKMG